MPVEISEIKHIRKKLGLTQSELAKRSGVSQSLIAKVESGILDPSYSNARKILNTLQTIRKKKELRAGQIMQAKIISVHENETPKYVIKKMKRYEISQLPVVKGSTVVGLISESILLDAILHDKEGHINEMMDDAPPTVSKDASVNVVSGLLLYYPIVIVGDKGKIRGIITKSDLLRKLYSR